MNRKNKNQKGFTLIELMVTVAVAIVVLAVGIPMYDRVIENSRSVSIINQMITDLQLARSEAIKQQLFVSLCTSTTGSSCTGGNDWHDGWIVWVDADDDGVLDYPSEALVVRDSFDGDWDLQIAIGAGDSNDSIFSYEVSGRYGKLTSSSGDGEFSIGDEGASFILCKASKYKRSVVIAPIGYIRQPRDSDSDGIKEDHNDTALGDSSCV